MRSFLIPLFALVCLAGCAQVLPAPSAAEVVDDRQLLVLTTEDPQLVISKAEPRGYEVTRIDDLSRLGETLIHLRIPGNLTIQQAIEEIELLEPGVTAGANHAYRLQSVVEEMAFANALIDWPAAGCRAYRPIGLIDAGVGADHPALRSGRIVQQVFHGTAQPPATDHGTLMADLLIGDGRLTGATLYSANAVDPSGAGGDVAGVDAILRSVNWLRDSGVDLINVSLAGPFNKLLDRGLGGAATDGAVFVAAAGNLGPSAPPQFPAAFPFVLAVTAVDRDLSAYRRAVRGDHIDLAAPGVDIVIQSGDTLRVISGTSAAAPYVTAIIAADRDLRSARSKDRVLNRLAGVAQDLGPSGRDATFGAGLVRAPETCAP
ncbi:MAG: S8 family serine peptidase [Pseudomonadota bacterium]